MNALDHAMRNAERLHRERSDAMAFPIIWGAIGALGWTIVALLLSCTPAPAQFTPPAASFTATAPIVVTPSPTAGKNATISCPTCGTGTGSVTSTSVATANGFSGTVATPTTTPAITLRAPGCTGLCKSNGTAISTATDGTDYSSPASLAGLMALQSPASVAITGGTITGMGNPTIGADVVNYTTALNLRSNVSAILATSAPLPNAPAYANGTTGVGATLTATTNGTLVIDGVTATGLGQVLIKDQVAQLQNGLYVITSIGGVSSHWSMVRSSNYNSQISILAQVPVCVAGGTNALTCWLQMDAVTTVGTDPLAYSQIGINPAVIAQTTGTPAAGNLTKFSGAAGITNGNLSGDCTTSGTLVTSCTATNEKCVTWDSTLAVTAQTIDFPIEWTSYTITSAKAKVAGGGSFTYSIQIGGTNVTGLATVTVNSSSNVNTTATAANTGSANDIISVVIASPTGTVNQAYVCPVFSHAVN